MFDGFTDSMKNVLFETHPKKFVDETGEHKKIIENGHGWFGDVADEVKEDAKYLQKKAGDAAEFVNQSCHDAADYVRGCPHEAVEKGSDEVDNAEKGKATFNESAGEYKMVPENQAQKVADAITGPSSEPEAHGWFDNMTEEVKEDAKYLQKKAGDAVDSVTSSIEHTFEYANQSRHNAAGYMRGSSHEVVEEGSDEVDNTEKENAKTAGEYKMVPENQGWFGNMADEVEEDAKYLQRKAGDAVDSVASSIEHTFDYVNQSRHDAADYMRGSPHETVEKACEEIEEAEKTSAEVIAKRGEFSEAVTKSFEKSQQMEI